MSDYVVGEYSPKQRMTREDVRQIANLYRQLFEKHQKRADAINHEHFLFMMEENHLWIARKDSVIVSMGMLIPNLKPIIPEAFAGVHDIVTDKKHRGKVYHGQSLAEVILKRMIEFGKFHQYKYLELTSAPSRIPANKLYQRLGFRLIAAANMGEKGATNLYRLYLR